MYIDRNTGMAVDEAQIRSGHPYTTFPIPFAPDPQRYATVKPTAQPEALGGHKVEQGRPVEVAGEWFEVWNQVAMTAEEVEADRVARVPTQVTMRQATQALILAGLDDDVDAMLAAMPGVEGKLARAEWIKSQVVERYRPLVIQMGVALGLTSEQVDQLFITAATL